MKKIMWLLLSLFLTVRPVIADPSDTPPVQAGQGKVYTDPANSSPHRSGRQGTPMAVMPPTGWTNLSGKVQSFDRTSETLQIRDKAGNFYIVPIDSQITITRSKKVVEFTQLHRGDWVHLHMTRHK